MIGAVFLQLVTGWARARALEAKGSNFSMFHRVCWALRVVHRGPVSTGGPQQREARFVRFHFAWVRPARSHEILTTACLLFVVFIATTLFGIARHCVIALLLTWQLNKHFHIYAGWFAYMSGLLQCYRGLELVSGADKLILPAGDINFTVSYTCTCRHFLCVCVRACECLGVRSTAVSTGWFRWKSTIPANNLKKMSDG